MTNFVEIINHDPEHGKNITMKRIIEVAVNACKTTHNDAELGAKLRVLFSDVETMAEFLELNSQSKPVTQHIVDDAMKQVAPEVRAPKVVREGKVKKKPAVVFKLAKGKSKPKRSGPPYPSEVIDKW